MNGMRVAYIEKSMGFEEGYLEQSSLLTIRCTVLGFRLVIGSSACKQNATMRPLMDHTYTEQMSETACSLPNLLRSSA